MAQSIPNRRKTVTNPELTRALKGFTPIFGNPQDRAIVDRLEKLARKLRSVDNEVLRGMKKGQMTPKMREVLGYERSLIAEIINRNNDF